MQELKEIQIEIKKELGGASLTHLLNYLEKEIGFIILINCRGCLYICFEIDAEFEQDFMLLNDKNQALNIFGQSEEFQRELYERIQIIKNIKNK